MPDIVKKQETDRPGSIGQAIPTYWTSRQGFTLKQVNLSLNNQFDDVVFVGTYYYYLRFRLCRYAISLLDNKLGSRLVLSKGFDTETCFPKL